LSGLRPIVIWSVIGGRRFNMLMTFTPGPGMLNTIVSGPTVAFALVIASRNDPSPWLLVLVTTEVLSCAAKFAICGALRLLKVRLTGGEQLKPIVVGRNGCSCRRRRSSNE
jgi:hypothetical protein